MKLPRFAALLVALSLSLSLFGCSPGRLHILIPDFIKNGVDGIRLYRIADGGGLKLAGRIAFGRLRSTVNGLELVYTQIVPGHNSFGPLVARAKRPRLGQLELEMLVYNPGHTGRFRFATYNERGKSKLADGVLYLTGGQSPQ
jgi:hypothetical protein